MNKTFIFLPNNLENNFLISCAKFGVNHFGTIFLSPNKTLKQCQIHQHFWFCILFLWLRIGKRKQAGVFFIVAEHYRPQNSEWEELFRDCYGI